MNAVLCRPQSCGWQVDYSNSQPAARTGFQKHFTIWYSCASGFAFRHQIGFRICHNFPQRRADSSSSFIVTAFLRLIMRGCHVQWRHHRCEMRNLDIIFTTFKNHSFFTEESGIIQYLNCPSVWRLYLETHDGFSRNFKFTSFRKDLPKLINFNFL
jgi:hypothetical protein